MDVLTHLGLILFGGVLLYFGAEWLVRGSSGLARTFGVPPLVIGLTVVAYGTSAPEMAVSVSANLNGSSELVLGNVIGSCVANLALILGVTALIAPPSVEKTLIKRELPVLLLSALSVPFVLLDGVITRFEAGILFFGAVAVSVLTVVLSKMDAKRAAPLESTSSSTQEDSESADKETLTRPMLALLTLLGLAVLVGGGDLFVKGAKGIAFKFGMSDRLVGLTVVAIGTSLPELAASIVAALRGLGGMAVGNVVGSNIFNIFLVLGVTALIAPMNGNLGALKMDLGFMIALTVVAMFFMGGDRAVSRVEGGILLTGYLAFIIMSIATS